MTTEPEETTGPITVQFAACSVCDALFLMSGRRETSPCHGADPVLVAATLVIQPDGDIAGAWGPGAPIGEPFITDSAESPPVAPDETPAAEAQEPAARETIPPMEVLRVGIQAFLDADPAVEDQLAGVFLDAGAEPEDAAAAVGRLEAVRTLIQKLSEPKEAVAAAVTAEETPPAAPEQPSPPDNAPEPA